MAQLTIDDVKRIAHLARLQLTNDEAANATKDLDKILGNFATLQAIDTEHVPMADAVSDQQNVMREDQAVSEYLCVPAELINRAPNQQQDQIKVPAVFS